MYDKILVALDGTGFGESVLSRVEDIARLNKSEVTLVTAMPEPQMIVVNGIIVSTVDQTEERDRQEAEAYLRYVARRLEVKGIRARMVVLVGDPTKEITRYARENNIGLIAMATRGRHGLDRVIHGSVANKIRQLATQPVLLYMPQKQSQAA